MSLFHLFEQLFKRSADVNEKQIINDLAQEHMDTSKLVWDAADLVSSMIQAEEFLNKTQTKRSRCIEIEDKLIDISYEIEKSGNSYLIDFVSSKLRRVGRSQYKVTQAMHLVSVKHMGYMR